MLLNRLCFVVCLMMILPAGIVRADEAADVLKDKGLSKQGNLLILGGESEVITGSRTLRLTRRKLDEEFKVRQNLDQKIKFARNTLAQWEFDRTQLNDRMAATRDAASQNQLIGRINAINGRIKQGEEEKKGMEAQAAKVANETKSQFIDAVLSLAPKAQDIIKQYADLAADDSVKAAIATTNETAKPRLKLGPSADFTAAANILKKWRLEVEDERIPLKVDNGLPTVEVTLNGTVTKQMILDSGANVVSLPGALADELKLVPGPRDPVVQVSMADGHTVEGRLMHLKSVRVGRFTVEDVECIVLPKSLANAAPLLGDSFLSHFVVKLDAAGGELRLVEVAGASKDVTTSTDGKDTAKPGTRGRAGTPAK